MTSENKKMSAGEAAVIAIRELGFTPSPAVVLVMNQGTKKSAPVALRSYLKVAEQTTVPADRTTLLGILRDEFDFSSDSRPEPEEHRVLMGIFSKAVIGSGNFDVKNTAAEILATQAQIDLSGNELHLLELLTQIATHHSADLKPEVRESLGVAWTQLGTKIMNTLDFNKSHKVLQKGIEGDALERLAESAHILSFNSDYKDVTSAFTAKYPELVAITDSATDSAAPTRQQARSPKAMA